jgi:hypothetical protein
MSAICKACEAKAYEDMVNFKYQAQGIRVHPGENALLHSCGRRDKSRLQSSRSDFIYLVRMCTRDPGWKFVPVGLCSSLEEVGELSMELKVPVGFYAAGAAFLDAVCVEPLHSTHFNYWLKQDPDLTWRLDASHAQWTSASD